MENFGYFMDGFIPSAIQFIIGIGIAIIPMAALTFSSKKPRTERICWYIMAVLSALSLLSAEVMYYSATEYVLYKMWGSVATVSSYICAFCGLSCLILLFIIINYRRKHPDEYKHPVEPERKMLYALLAMLEAVEKDLAREDLENDEHVDENHESKDTPPASNDGGSPANGGGTPANDGGSPANDGGSPANDGGSPANGGGTPANGGETPGASNHVDPV